MILVYMGSGRLMNMVLEQATGRPVSGESR